MRTIGLLGMTLLAATGMAQAPAPGETIAIELSNFKFAPATIKLHHGTAYVLHIVNSAKGGHDFSAKAFFAAAQIDPEDAKRIKDGKIDLEGGDVVDIHLTAPATGRYELHCAHMMHETFGMKGAIEVE